MCLESIKITSTFNLEVGHHRKHVWSLAVASSIDCLIMGSKGGVEKSMGPSTEPCGTLH